jgi:CheY-like chemotaxis protein
MEMNFVHLHFYFQKLGGIHMGAIESQNRQTAVRPKIMLVDDQECIRETISDLLASEGIDILTAVGSNECLQLLRNGFRGVILMDVNMPGLDGWSTIREIEKEGFLQGNIISMLTSVDVPDERMEGLQEVVIDYMTKPFEPEPFIATIRKYLALLDQMKGTD